jgi:Cu(I)/Ag(I) efflux system protein CusF
MIRLAVLVCGLVLAAAIQAQSMQGMQHEATEHGSVHKANGTVTKVDREKSRVTIKHGAVATLEWPAMTMTFAVEDQKLMEKLQQGKQVQFQFAQQGKDYVITEVK